MDPSEAIIVASFVLVSSNLKALLTDVHIGVQSDSLSAEAKRGTTLISFYSA